MLSGSGGLSGDEPFVNGEVALPFTVADFWRWSASDLVGNALRGLVAEYLVAQALGAETTGRVEWDAVDLRLPDGRTVEVKTSGYLQSWPQKALSRPSFDVAPKRGWDSTTNTYVPDIARRATFYVFALHHHTDRATVNPRDVRQWSFYVVPTGRLDAAYPTAKRLSLSKVIELAGSALALDQLRQLTNSLAR